MQGCECVCIFFFLNPLYSVVSLLENNVVSTCLALRFKVVLFFSRTRQFSLSLSLSQIFTHY